MIIVQVHPRLVTIQRTEDAQEMEINEPRSEAAPEAERMTEPEEGFTRVCQMPGMP